MTSPAQAIRETEEGPFYTEPGTGRRLFATLGYTRGPETRIYVAVGDGASREWVIEALNAEARAMDARMIAGQRYAGPAREPSP